MCALHRDDHSWLKMLKQARLDPSAGRIQPLYDDVQGPVADLGEDERKDGAPGGGQIAGSGKDSQDASGPGRLCPEDAVNRD
jgi:hypothetical protein